MSFGFSVGSPVKGIFFAPGAASVAVDGDGSGATAGASGAEGVVEGACGTVVLSGVGAEVHSGGRDVVVGVVAAVVVVVGAVVVGVSHGSTGAGALGDGAAVGAGVVVGCADAPVVPEIITNATVPAVNNDLLAERVRGRGGRVGVDGSVIDFFLLAGSDFDGSPQSYLTKPGTAPTSVD